MSDKKPGLIEAADLVARRRACHPACAAELSVDATVMCDCGMVSLRYAVMVAKKREALVEAVVKAARDHQKDGTINCRVCENAIAALDRFDAGEDK